MLTKAGTVKKKLKNAGGVLLLPVLSGVMMAIACRIAGTALFTGIGTWQLFFRGLAYVLLLSFGVSINMHTGRFDFSAGATMLIGGVSGALIATHLQHDCPGENCPVCAAISTLEQLLRGMALVAVLGGVLLLAQRSSGVSTAARFDGAAAHTLVTLKVKLSD